MSSATEHVTGQFKASTAHFVLRLDAMPFYYLFTRYTFWIFIMPFMDIKFSILHITK